MRNGFESITDFIFMEDAIEKADVILIPGGSKPELMQKAADLYFKGYAKYILPSGHYNKKIPEFISEYAYLKSIGIKLGVPETAFIKEDKARHTFENGQLSYRALLEKGINPKKVILVCKSFHARRAFLTYKINFPKDVVFIVQPIVDDHNITKDNWLADECKIERVLSEVTKIGQYFGEHIKGMR